MNEEKMKKAIVNWLMHFLPFSNSRLKEIDQNKDDLAWLCNLLDSRWEEIRRANQILILQGLGEMDGDID